MGFSDFVFGSNDAQRATEKAAQASQWSPFLYAGPGGSLSGFGSIAQAAPGQVPTQGTPSLNSVGTSNGNIVQGGFVDSGYKSDGNKYPILIDPRTGQGYVNVKGQMVPAQGKVVGPDGKKVALGANGAPPGYQAPAAQSAVQPGAQMVPTPQGGIQQQIPGGSPTGGAAPAAGFQQSALTGPSQGGGLPGAGPGGPAPDGTVIAPSNMPGQTGFGDLGNLNPIQAALVKAFPQLIQQGVRQSGGVDPNVNPGASPYNAFGDVYQHNLQLLREQAKPQEDQQYNSLQNRLFAQGRLGSTGGNMNIEAFAKGLGEADVQRQLSAFGVSQGVAQQQEQARLADAGINAQNIDRAINQGNMTFGQAQQLFGNLASLNQIGSQNFTNALNASIARSNANAGAAGALAQVPADNGAFGSILSAAAKAYAGA